LLFPIAVAGAMGLSGCCLNPEPEGRCGIADICDPVVMPDPLPYDKCVPPKGVDCGHYGYVRTSWRVLNPRDPDCCLMESPCMETIPQVMPEPIPAGAEKVDFQAILKDDERESDSKDALAIAPMTTPVGEHSEVANAPSYIRESVDVVRQAYGVPTETDVILR
jgi:hypothetical protein